jgi:hypothetical protein
MALPGNFQGQINMTGEDLIKMMRWPSDVIPDAANVVGRGFSTAQYNKWAGPQGYATIDPKMQQFGTATLFGDIEGLADITQVDMADAHQFLGMGVSQFVQERMMSTQASTSDIRAQAGRSAIAKGRIGMASNLMDLMKYYSEADRAGMTGGARDLASQAQFDAWSLMGAVKQGYTDQWPNIMDISEQTASDYFMPMNLSGFRGARNRPGAFTRQVPGRMDIEGRVSGARRGIGAGEVFPTFARAAATFGSQLMSPEILTVLVWSCRRRRSSVSCMGCRRDGRFHAYIRLRSYGYGAHCIPGTERSCCCYRRVSCLGSEACGSNTSSAARHCRSRAANGRILCRFGIHTGGS